MRFNNFDSKYISTDGQIANNHANIIKQIDDGTLNIQHYLNRGANISEFYLRYAYMSALDTFQELSIARSKNLDTQPHLTQLLQSKHALLRSFKNNQAHRNIVRMPNPQNNAAESAMFNHIVNDDNNFSNKKIYANTLAYRDYKLAKSLAPFLEDGNQNRNQNLTKYVLHRALGESFVYSRKESDSFRALCNNRHEDIERILARGANPDALAKQLKAQAGQIMQYGMTARNISSLSPREIDQAAAAFNNSTEYTITKKAEFLNKAITMHYEREINNHHSGYIAEKIFKRGVNKMRQGISASVDSLREPEQPDFIGFGVRALVLYTINPALLVCLFVTDKPVFQSIANVGRSCINLGSSALSAVVRVASAAVDVAKKGYALSIGAARAIHNFIYPQQAAHAVAAP